MDRIIQHLGYFCSIERDFLGQLSTHALHCIQENGLMAQVCPGLSTVIAPVGQDLERVGEFERFQACAAVKRARRYVCEFALQNHDSRQICTAIKRVVADAGDAGGNLRRFE